MEITIPTIQPPEADQQANNEAVLFAEDSLEEKARKNDHERREKFRHHVSCAAVAIFWAMVIGVTLMGFAWIYHIITPVAWHWLDSEQISRIQAMLFSGVIASVIPAYAKRYI